METETPSLDDNLESMSVNFMIQRVRENAIVEILIAWQKILVASRFKHDPVAEKLKTFFANSPFGCQAQQARELISAVVGYDVCTHGDLPINLGYIVSRTSHGSIIPVLSIHNADRNVVKAHPGEMTSTSDAVRIKFDALRYATIDEAKEYLATAPNSHVVQIYEFLCGGK